MLASMVTLKLVILSALGSLFLQPLALSLSSRTQMVSESLMTSIPTVSATDTTTVLVNGTASPAISVDSLITCFKQPSTIGPLYRPIVLEDCYQIFAQILLAENILNETLYIAGEGSYKRQNGNCIFLVEDGPTHRTNAYLTEFEMAVAFAKIVNRCVTSSTEYLGGLQGLAGSVYWFAQVIGDRPPVISG